MAKGGSLRYAEDLATGLRSLEAPEVKVLEVGRETARAFSPRGNRAVAQLAGRWEVDLIHGLHLEVPRTTVPCIVTVHDLIPLEHPGLMPSRTRRVLYRRVIAQALARARLVLVPSKMTADSLVAYGLSRERIRIVPHGVSRRFRPPTTRERDAARERFGGGEPYVAAVSGIKEHKNLPLLCEVAERLTSLGVKVVARVSGAISVPPSIVLLNHLSDDQLRMFYGGAEAFLLPSMIEGFGLPLLEAAACGTPCIAGRRVGATSYIGHAVEVVDIGDVDSTVGSILRARERDRDSVRRAVSGLTLTGMAERTAAVYREAIGSDSR